MWMITEKGFISAVAYNEKKDPNAGKMSRRRKKLLKSRPILARARVKEDLEQLREFFPKLVIEDNKSADYEFRALVPREAFMEWAASYAGKIDYDSHFKEVARDRSPAATGRYNAMMAVWTAMSKLQPNKPYGGGFGSDLCDYREVEINIDGTKKLGKWCNFKRGHEGKCEFEVKGGGQHGKEMGASSGYTYQPTLPAAGGGVKMCKGRDAVRGACTLPQGHGGVHKWQYPAQSDGNGCKHRVHEYRNGAWMGSFGTNSGIWYSCDKYGGGTASALRESDTVLGMLYALSEKAIGEVEVDKATPDACWEIWSGAEFAFGGECRLSEQNVADLLADLIEDEALAEHRDVYLEALDEFGYELDDSNEEDGAIAVPHKDDLPVPGEQVTTAVAENEGVVK